MEKLDIYPYHRSGKKTKYRPLSRIKLPSLGGAAKGLKMICSFETLILVIMAVLCGRALLFGELAPFGPAFVGGMGAVFPEAGLITAIFALIGYSTVLNGPELWATGGALLITCVILRKYHHRFRKVWYGPPSLVLVVVITIKVAFAAYYEPGLYKYLTAILEALLASGLTYIFFRAAPLLKKRTIRYFRWEERLVLPLILVGVLAGISGLEIGFVNLQKVVSCFLVLVAVFIGGSGWGAAAGTLVGAVPSLTSAVAPGLIGYFAFAGLIGGVFRNFGRIGISLGFLLADVLLSIYYNSSHSMAVAMSESFAAVVLFMILPTKNLHRIRNMTRASYGEKSTNSRDQRIRDYSARKIRDFARIFSEAAKTFNQISCELQNANEEKELQQLFNGLTGKVCSGCSLYRVCWETDFYKTYKVVMDLLAILETNARIDEEQLAPELKKRCIRQKEIAITVSCLYETYKSNHYWRRKMIESREIVSGQLKGVSEILQGLAKEVRLDVQMREDIEAILKGELVKAGHSVIDLSVVSLGNERLEVNVSCPSCGGKMQCYKVINPIVSQLLGQQMTVINNNYCTKKTGEPVCEFKLHPDRTYRVNVGQAMAAKNGGVVSGDSCRTLEMRDGKMVLVLSDGMGVGAKASLESSATIDLLEQLLETGFDKSLAVKTVNSILVLKTPEETFSTVDLAMVDQYSGMAGFIKIGAAPSFVKSSSKVDTIKYSSLPIGILNNIDVDCIEYRLNPGDVVVMVSDGILDSKKDSPNKEEWVVTLLRSIITTDPQNIADLILNRAIQNAGGIVDDDMTVLVAEIKAGTFC